MNFNHIIDNYGIELRIIGGLIIAFMLGELFAKIVQHIQKIFEKDIESWQESRFPATRWYESAILDEKFTRPTTWLGWMEIVFFYFCFWQNMPEGIGMWLVFKVAVKWESWNNIVKMPDKIKYGQQESDDIEYLKLRNKLATMVSQKFFIGTLGNILASAVGWYLV